MITLTELETRLSDEATLAASVETVKGYLGAQHGLHLYERHALGESKATVWVIPSYNICLGRADIVAIAEEINAKQ